jgi:DNA-binding GntR family transcriptional regulator
LRGTAGAGNSSLVDRRVLREQIRNYLIQDILEGRRAPGDRVIETRVARTFNVSQTPVREALRDLEMFGFVTIIPFRGAVVRETSTEDLLQVNPIRAMLEGFAARQAATRINEAGLKRLAMLLQRMRKAADSGDDRACVDADLAFHSTIVEASGNWLLMQFWERMRLASSTLITITKTKHSLHEVAEHHVPLLEALTARNPKQAERTMRRHIETAGNWLRASFKKRGDDHTKLAPTAFAKRRGKRVMRPDVVRPLLGRRSASPTADSHRS